MNPLKSVQNGLALNDIDILQAIADEGRKERERQLAICEQIIEEQLERFGFGGSGPRMVTA